MATVPSANSTASLRLRSSPSFAVQSLCCPTLCTSKSEERFKGIGKSDDGRWIFLVFTLRTRGGMRFVRPISARFMHKKEVEHYEKETATLQKR
jgi:uncharacterized DUF497 family protein